MLSLPANQRRCCGGCVEFLGSGALAVQHSPPGLVQNTTTSALRVGSQSDASTKTWGCPSTTEEGGRRGRRGAGMREWGAMGEREQWERGREQLHPQGARTNHDRGNLLYGTAALPHHDRSGARRRHIGRESKRRPVKSFIHPSLPRLVQSISCPEIPSLN